MSFSLSSELRSLTFFLSVSQFLVVVVVAGVVVVSGVVVVAGVVVVELGALHRKLPSEHIWQVCTPQQTSDALAHGPSSAAQAGVVVVVVVVVVA